MSISDALLAEFDIEMATTRRLLERVPADKGQWKPHAKSFSLGHLAQLVSWIPGWITNTLTKASLDLGGADRGVYSYEKTENLLATFDKNVKEAREALQAATSISARLMRVEKDLGTVERGKRADLLVLDANPLENISNIRSVRYVMKDGRMFESAALWTAAGFKP